MYKSFYSSIKLLLLLLLLLQRLPLTRAFEGFFFCLFKPEFSWTSINCFHGFPRALTEKVPSSLNEGRIISNDDVFLSCFIKMKDYIVKTTRSLRAEWNSRNILHSLRNGYSGCLFLMYKNTGAVDDWIAKKLV